MKSSPVKSITWYINCAITLAIMLLFRFIPAPDPLTPFGMSVAGIFLGMLYGWLTLDFFFPSLAALILIGFTGYTTPEGAVATLFSNPQVLLVLFMMLAMAILSTTGVTEYLAKWIVNRRFLKGRPWMFILMIMIATAIIALIGNAVGAGLIMWPAVKKTFENVGYKKGEKTPAFIMFGVVVVGNAATMMMPFQMPALSTFGVLFATSNGEITSFNSGAYLLFATLFVVVSVVLFMILVRFLVHIDIEKLRNYEPDPASVPAMKKNDKIGLALFVLLFVCLICSSIVSATSAFGEFFVTLGSVGACILVIMIAVAIKFKDGSTFVEFQKLGNGIAWGLVFMFGTAMVLSGAINSENTGIIPFLSQYIAPVFSGMNSTMFFVVFSLIALIATNFLNNMVVASIMVPVGYALCTSLGINPVAVTAAFCIVNTNALFFPSGSPAGALLHDNDGWIQKGQIYRWCGIYLVVVYVLMVVMGYPLSNVMF